MVMRISELKDSPSERMGDKKLKERGINIQHKKLLARDARPIMMRTDGERDGVGYSTFPKTNILVRILRGKNFN